MIAVVPTAVAALRSVTVATIRTALTALEFLTILEGPARTHVCTCGLLSGRESAETARSAAQDSPETRRAAETREGSGGA